MTAQEKFASKIEKKNHICVGLDTDINKIPNYLRDNENPVLEFNKIIIENTYEYVGAYKINFAFYESEGVKGLENISRTMELIPNNIPVIGDAKRGDIGNTSQMYAKSLFEHFKMDASTLNPYMGIDSVQPFLEYEDKINFILALTSNKSAIDFEKLKIEDGDYLFQKIIKKVHEWNDKKNLGIVFGATNNDELISNLSIIKNLPVLLPGVGAQGGSLEEVVTAFKNAESNNFIINVSRGIIYADSSENFGDKAKEILKQYNLEISKLLT